jgi:hypothetical protein
MKKILSGLLISISLVCKIDAVHAKDIRIILSPDQYPILLLGTKAYGSDVTHASNHCELYAENAKLDVSNSNREWGNPHEVINYKSNGQGYHRIKNPQIIDVNFLATRRGGYGWLKGTELTTKIEVTKGKVLAICSQTGLELNISIPPK